MVPEKLLVLRLSSFGDVVQGLGVPTCFKSRYPDSEVHWLVRADFADVVRCARDVDHVWSFARGTGLVGLLKLAFSLRAQGFTHLYDAHNNLRSHVVSFVLRLPGKGRVPKFIRRSKERFKRLALFYFRKNLFPKPYRGQVSYLKPLEAWGLPQWPPSVPFQMDELPAQFLGWFAKGKSVVALAPSAAWKMKRWPVAHWKELIRLRPDERFVLLGGPQDTFCEEIARVAPERVLNLAGKLNLAESMSVLEHVKQLVSADTGLLHVADLLAVPCVALIGPTAFGYPSRFTSRTLEVELACKPCSKDGRGNCVQKIYQKCMVDILPQKVSSEIL